MAFTLILALITLGMTRIAGRETRQALDRQLSAQAYYSAETGINDARNAINKDPTNIPTNIHCDDATADPNFYKDNHILNAGYAEYTCLLINAQTGDVLKDITVDGSPTVFTVKYAKPIQTLVFNWKSSPLNKQASSAAPSNPFRTDFKNPVDTLGNWSTQNNNYTNTPLLKVSIYPVSGNAGNNMPSGPPGANTLQSRARTFFLYPTASSVGGGGTADWALANNGSQLNGKCFNTSPPPTYNTYSCSVSIKTVGVDGLTPPDIDSYVIRVSTLYSSASLDLEGLTGSNVTDTTGTQAVIDSTGKGADVYKRLKVSIPLGTNANRDVLVYPDAAIRTSDSICKRFRVPLDGSTVGGPEAGVTDSACNF